MVRVILKVIFIVFCLIKSKQMYCQNNMVLNGGFEDTVHCPTGAVISNAKYFSSPTSQGTPDYFNACADISTNYSVPFNGFGFQHAHSGNAYAGIVAYGYGGNYREYIQVPLINTLEDNQVYLVKYYVSLGNFSPICHNNLGFTFSKDFISENGAGILNQTDSYSCKTVIKDTLSWTELSWYYTSNGNEKYLIIGNFKADYQTDTLANISSTSDPYYFIDDISVTKINIDIPNVFTPNGDGVNDSFYFNNKVINATEINILNRWGNIVYYSTNNFTWDGITNSGELCSQGTYFYIIKTTSVR